MNFFWILEFICPHSHYSSVNTERKSKKVHISIHTDYCIYRKSIYTDCEKGAQISILANKIATQ